MTGTTSCRARGRKADGSKIALAAALLIGAALLLRATALAGGVTLYCAKCGVEVPNHQRGCPWDPSSRSSGSSSGGRSSSSTSSSGHSKHGHKKNPNRAILEGIDEGLQRAFTPDPEVIRQINETRRQGAQATQTDQLSQQSALESHQATAVQNARIEHEKTVQGLAASLQGLPRNGGTLESLREGAGSGFDTRGGIYGAIPAPPPPIPSPSLPATASTSEEEASLPQRMTPNAEELLRQRKMIEEQKRGIENRLVTLEAKGKPTPEESKTMRDLRKDLYNALHKKAELDTLLQQALAANDEAGAALDRANNSDRAGQP